MTKLAAALALIVAIGWSQAAAAQVSTAAEPSFSVERFTPPPGRAGFVVVDDPDVLPRGAWAFGLGVALSARPIVLRDLETGEEATTPVAGRVAIEAGGAYGLGPRYQVGVAIPMALQWGDRLRGTGLDDGELAPVVFGDVRLYGKARLAGEPGARGLGAAFAATLILPSGAEAQLAGEAATALEWRVELGYRTARFAVAANGGLRLRTEEVRFLSPSRPHGNELLGGVAAEVIVPGLRLDQLSAIGEVDAVRGDSIGGDLRGPSPGEAKAGLRWRADRWSITAAAGGGFTPDEVGSPAWRASVTIAWDQVPTSDVDRDGVVDGRDGCVAVAEDRDGFDDGDGCPELDDDRDGVMDADDQCPRVPEDVDGWRDADGCPDDEQRLEP